MALVDSMIVKGSVRGSSYSSRRWKENIHTIDAASEKVQKLRGVEFDWKADGKHDIGLIAEEVGKVIPEVVVYEENRIDAKSVNYPRLVALLIEAFKEQQVTIDALRVRTEKLEMILAASTQVKSDEKELVSK